MYLSCKEKRRLFTTWIIRGKTSLKIGAWAALIRVMSWMHNIFLPDSCVKLETSRENIAHSWRKLKFNSNYWHLNPNWSINTSITAFVQLTLHKAHISSRLILSLGFKQLVDLKIWDVGGKLFPRGNYSHNALHSF